ncbi:MAG: beta-aspartyl-peptidase [Flavobacteriaceae bacterium]|nr:beta-aspartyl-peptidase [Flavobacteriaceae bacterium]|tara:strand:- start:13324 stop:14346 length:1023 start_codon:yes stop_codon:yes gene_type:complete
MRFIVATVCLLFFSCNESIISSRNKSDIPFSIVIHGGAGTILKENMTNELEKAYLNKLEEAIRVGYSLLENGASSQEAVEKSINIMEDSPLFNAGKGAVLNSNSEVELDASFMNGKTLDAGAISGASSIKNPISAAIAVMENSPHVMLSGKGADTFAAIQGLDSVPNSYFITERRLNALKKVKKYKTAYFFKNGLYENLNQLYGTVGCVALDKEGNISAGTSTGGMTNKKWNRIGDAPIIGAGTYANNKSCGVSATGWGEFFIRSVAAHDIANLVEYKKISIKDAARIVIHEKIAVLGGSGGVIAIDSKGNVAMEMNTKGMYRAHMDSKGNFSVKIYSDD